MKTLSAQEAAKLLGVRVTTIYAYASRGLLRSVASSKDSRKRSYYEGEVLRLKKRGEAHRGEQPAAASALDWGAPVIETAISAITPAGPKYRGHIARTLARDGCTFEQVLDLLWGGEVEHPGTSLAMASPLPDRFDEGVPDAVTGVDRIRLAISRVGLEDMTRFTHAESVQRGCARRAIAAALASIDPVASSAPSVASGLARALVGEGDDAHLVRALDATLIMVADHELNASTFAARVAASTGADLYACLEAALATFTGPRHGGASALASAILRDIAASDSAERALMSWVRRGESLAGLDHPLYPHGDPRCEIILEHLPPGPDTDAARELYTSLTLAVERMGQGKPNVDMGLALLERAARLPRGSASLIFAIGRFGGWLAHAMEQRASPQLLRPRARYIGPPHAS